MTTRTVYQLNAWADSINARELAKETAHYYTFRRTLPDGQSRDDREAKNGAYPLHETWAGAHAKLNRTRADLERYESRLAAIQAMKRP